MRYYQELFALNHKLNFNKIPNQIRKESDYEWCICVYSFENYKYRITQHYFKESLDVESFDRLGRSTAQHKNLSVDEAWNLIEPNVERKRKSIYEEYLK